MAFGSRDKDTICSVSTPNGIGGISVIRISGSEGLKIVSKLIKNPPKLIESHRVFLVNLMDFSSNSIIDEVCITPFLNKKSFTGEEVIEISCHGSPVICQKILEQLCRNGARLAERGEFTYRAFINGRIDLVQAESVLSVIHSKTELSSKLALRQLKGELSQKIKLIEDQILWCLAHIEASIDFSAEDIEIIQDDVLLEKLSNIEAEMQRLISSFSTGKMISDGVQLTLSGKPNTGKSSLMNLFLQSDRSIISPIAGTTRDVIKDEFIYDGIRFILADTAGIRNETDDVIEKIGIQRAIKEQNEAQINLLLLDLFENPSAFDDKQFLFLKNLDLKQTYLILNKADLFFKSEEIKNLSLQWKSFFNKKEQSGVQGWFDEFLKMFSSPHLRSFFMQLHSFLQSSFIDFTDFDFHQFFSKNIIICSSQDPESRSLILDNVKKHWVNSENQIENISVSSARQFDDLVRAHQLLHKTKEAISNRIGHEYIAFDLKDSLLAVQNILGIVYDDQILDKVFKEFCLGK